MKKILFMLPLILAFVLVVPTFAARNSEVGAQTVQRTQEKIQERLHVSSYPTGYQEQNQNEVQTQNQDEDNQLQINTQEQENSEKGKGEGLQNRNENALQNMSEVSKQVQQLLLLETTGEIGDQVRQIAKEQNQAQTQIQEQLNKLDSKSKIAKFLTGTDYKAVKNLRQEMEQNQLRIAQLEQLQNQLYNQAELTAVQETIQALIQENTSLQEKIVAEEQMRSVFGWLLKYFQ